MPICAQTVAATRSLSPVRTLTATPLASRVATAPAALALGGSRKAEKAHQHHVAFVGDAKLAHAARIGFLRHGNYAQALGVKIGDLFANLGEALVGERLGDAIDLDKGADLEHFLGSSLGNHLGFALGVGDNYAQATAREIEGNLVDLGIAVAQALAQHGIGCDGRGRHIGAVDNGQVDKVFEAGLEEAV